VSAKVLSSSLYRILHEASLFASRDEALPMLNAVQLEGTSAGLLAAGTDRFSLGASWTPWADDSTHTPFQMVIPLEQVQLMMALLRPSGRRRVRKGAVDLRVTPKATRLWLRAGDISLMVTAGRNLTFPSWRQLIPTAKTDATPPTWAMDPTKLARFSKIDRPGGAHFYSGGPNKPLCVTMGDDFVGLVMPVRLADDATWAAPDWVTGK
jgi:hypothetical protein